MTTEHVRKFDFPIERDGMLDAKEIADVLRIALGAGEHVSAEEFERERKKLPPDSPSGTYVCGCPWSGAIIPHFCPLHSGAWPIFEIREPQS